MSDQLVMIGGGRHCHNLIGHLHALGYNISHVLDDRPQASLLGYEVRDLTTGLKDVHRAHLAVGTPEMKRQIVEKCRAFPQIEWVSILHPKALISPDAGIGVGCFIGPFVTTADITMAEQVTVQPYTLIGARVEIGPYSLISSHCSIHSDAYIGADTVIGSGVHVMAGVRIGDRCRISPNSVVNNDIPSDHLVVTASRTRIFPIV